mgnify:CR=1 FL=1
MHLIILMRGSSYCLEEKGVKPSRLFKHRKWILYIHELSGAAVFDAFLVITREKKLKPLNCMKYVDEYS